MAAPAVLATSPAASIPAEAIIGGAGGGSSIDLNADIVINSINAGRGNGNELSNTVFGLGVLQLNDGGTNNSGFGSDCNQAILLDDRGREKIIEPCSKLQLAHYLFDFVNS